VSSLAAAVLAAGELICEFTDGYRKSLLAEIAGDPPRTEVVMVYEAVTKDSAQVLSTKRPGRRPVSVRATELHVHFIQAEGPSVRVTTLTGCTRQRSRADGDICTRFSARHAWHFDHTAHFDADGAFSRLPSGGATGSCEPWKVD
jgi:hypothetical protein